MTVQELIDKLSEMPREMRVACATGDWDFDEVSAMGIVKGRINDDCLFPPEYHDPDTEPSTPCDVVLLNNDMFNQSN